MLELKKIFSDGAVFQQNTENEISGSADAGKEIRLSLFKNESEIFSVCVLSDNDGRWNAVLPPANGGKKPYKLHIECGGDMVEVNDIYFGELFHISGQSNMELPLRRTLDPLKEAPVLEDYHYIREFRAAICCCFSKEAAYDDFAGGSWRSAEGERKLDISAAGYYFAAEIFKRLDVPIGLVNTSAGGAAVESFMPYAMVRKYEIHNEFLEKATRENYMQNMISGVEKREREWTESLGNENFGLKPSDNMKSCIVPCLTNELEGLESFSGRIFFFREFFIPDDFPLSGAELILGTITDSDSVYINGVKTGETGYMYPPRYYPLPEGVLKRGINTAAVRIDVKNGCGGFTKGKRYCLKSGSRIIELSGRWKYAVASEAEAFKESSFVQDRPIALYSKLMAPAMKLKYRALVWYQGETNCGRAHIYKQMFSDFIDFYRGECGYEIPVIFTQLCNYEGMCGSEGSRSWAALRNAQLECLEISSTAMAVTADLGEYNDLHPKNKRDVGKRLAYCAGGLLYGDDTVFVRCTGASAAVLEDKTVITLSFDGPAFLKNGKTGAFEIVFEDGVYGCAEQDSEKCSDTLRICCNHCGKPKYVWYAQSNNPAELDLYDLTLKPLSPFEISIG